VKTRPHFLRASGLPDPSRRRARLWLVVSYRASPDLPPMASESIGKPTDEFCAPKVEREFDDYTVYVYLPDLILSGDNITPRQLRDVLTA